MTWTLDDITVDFVDSNIVGRTPGTETTIRLGFESAAEYRRAREYVDSATGQHVYHGQTGSSIWLSEREEDKPVQSHIVELTPGADLPDDYPGLWLAILGGTEPSRPGSSQWVRVLELDVLVIAQSSEFGRYDDILYLYGSDPPAQPADGDVYDPTGDALGHPRDVRNLDNLTLRLDGGDGQDGEFRDTASGAAGIGGELLATFDVSDANVIRFVPGQSGASGRAGYYAGGSGGQYGGDGGAVTTVLLDGTPVGYADGGGGSGSGWESSTSSSSGGGGGARGGLGGSGVNGGGGGTDAEGSGNGGDGGDGAPDGSNSGTDGGDGGVGYDATLVSVHGETIGGSSVTEGRIRIEGVTEL